MSPFYRFLGNSLHALNLLNIVAYGSMIYAFGTDPESTVFDKSWLQAGFCLPRNEVDYFTTHDLSGYIMTFLALVGLLLQHYLSRQPSIDTVQQRTMLSKADNLAYYALLGALGHAWGHCFIAFGIRGDFYPPAEETFLDDLKRSSLLSGVGKACPGYIFFWIPLVKTYMMNTAKGRVAIIAFVCWIGSLFMQVRFGFSYTQSVLFAGLSMDQLMLPDTEKGFEFALWPLITTVPNGIFAWIESTTCTSSPLMMQHGHIVYDVYMVSSYILFYLICWARVNYTVVKTKTI